MRIAFVVGRFPVISETFILNQITGLIDRGHEVDIYANTSAASEGVHQRVEQYRLLDRTFYRPPMPPGAFGRLLVGTSLILRHLFTHPIAVLHALNALRYGRAALSLELLFGVMPWLRSKPYDVVHCHFGPNGNRCAILRDIGVIDGKLLTTFHGHDVNRYPRQHGPNVYKRLFARGDRYTVNTTFTADRAIELGCPADAIVKLPVGLSMSEYVFRERSCGPGETVRILTVARLVEKKGLEYSIQAVAQVLQRFPNLEYRIIGDGDLRPALASLIDRLEVSKNVKLLGSMTEDEVRKIYDSSHLFVLSSVTAADGDQEGQGLVLQEAQAVGLPVISTLHNGIPEGVLDGQSGFLVPERDVSALAEKLAYLLKHPDVWPKMGRAGREFVEQHYDIEKLNDRLVELYRTLLDV